MRATYLVATLCALSSAHSLACTPIASVPFTIAAPGTYCLAGDLSESTGGYAITVNADFVTIDFRGYSITGVGTHFGAGVHGFARRNVIVRNGSLRRFSDGIFFQQSFNIVVENMAVSNTSHAIRLPTSAHASVRANRIADVNAYGIHYYVPISPVLPIALDHSMIFRDNVISDVGKLFGGASVIGGYGIVANGYSSAIIHNNSIGGVRGAGGSGALVVGNSGLVVENKIASSVAGIQCTGGSPKSVRNVLANGLSAGSSCLKYDNF